MGDLEDVDTEPVAREYFLRRYVRPLLRRTYERREAAIYACPLVKASKTRGDVDRTCPACGAIVRDNFTIRYKR